MQYFHHPIKFFFAYSPKKKLAPLFNNSNKNNNRTSHTLIKFIYLYFMQLPASVHSKQKKNYIIIYSTNFIITPTDSTFKLHFFLIFFLCIQTSFSIHFIIIMYVVLSTIRMNTTVLRLSYFMLQLFGSFILSHTI